MAFRVAAAFLLGILAVGCQRAGRYPSAAAAPAPVREKSKPAAEPIWSWYLPEGWQPPPDTPLTFIRSGSAEWTSLPGFWNQFPPPAAGTRTIHLGQAPLGAVAAFTLADRLEVVKIKVPLGLPDPAPHIPAANPLTLAKWKLGRRIFFDRKLSAGSDRFACASCHQPEHGFAEDRSIAQGGSRNTLALLNTVYNRHQFWDGRAAALEETLVRTLDDELLAQEEQPERRPQETHRWGGLVRALGNDADYRDQFRLVFGSQPTQDTIAKALATYLRTILSGNSIYDRAEEERRYRKAPEVRAEHFAAVLDDKAIEGLQTPGDTKASAAKKLQQGHRLFESKGCVICHSGPLFTDHDFHNIGIGDSDRRYPPGRENGRFVHAPIGLKEARLIGAYRTPTLRALPRTGPYFHDGSAPRLALVVKYFNLGPASYRDYLAEPLRADAEGHGKALGLDDEEQQALVLFLRALDGEPVDRTVAAAP